jgi:hypothetical protein
MASAAASALAIGPDPGCLIYVGGSTRHDAIVRVAVLERESRDADI